MICKLLQMGIISNSLAAHLVCSRVQITPMEIVAISAQAYAVVQRQLTAGPGLPRNAATTKRPLLRHPAGHFEFRPTHSPGRDDCCGPRLLRRAALLQQCSTPLASKFAHARGSSRVWRVANSLN